MPLDANEVADALSERQHAERVIDRWAGTRTYYQDFQKEWEDVLRIYRNEWTMRWPDGRTERMDPAVPNMVRIAADDRARAIASTRPSIVCHPEGPGDEARQKADKLERIVQALLQNARIHGNRTQMWAYDFMGAGIAVCKVMPDFLKPQAERFPTFTRLEPGLSYPDPVFTPGPFCDSFIYAYEEKVRTVEKRFGVEIDWLSKQRDPNVKPDKIRVIEFYDDEYITVAAQEFPLNGKPGNVGLIMQEKHKLGCCPVVIGARATMDGMYRGEFGGALGVLDYWNRLMTMIQDDAIRKVYPERLTYNVQNPEDYGPDANIELETPDARYEYVQQGNQAFSNLQIVRDVQGFVRAGMLMPLSRSGDPNESIISAAGISASQTQFNEDIRSVSRDGLAPMLEAAIEVALKGEEVWSPNATKSMWAGEGTRNRETYVPSKDIAGYRRVTVRYGIDAGLDPINQNVMVLQQLGAGIIDQRTAMEMSPFVEDPQRVEKRKLKEQFVAALMAGLQLQAQQGIIDPFTLAMIDQALESDEVSLSEAIMALAPSAPLAQPQQQGQPGGPSPAVAPGTAGAAEAIPGQEPLPALTDLIGA